MNQFIISPETFFYTIKFEQNEQCLTRELLNKHYPVPKGWKAFMGNKTQYLDYKNGIVIVRVVLNDGSDNKLYLHVGSDELHIACTCGMPCEKLCYHGFMGLHHLGWQSIGLELGKFYWPGLDHDEKFKRKFLDIEVKHDRIKVSAKERYGNIFKPVLGFKNNNVFLKQSQLILNKTRKENPESVIAYCLAYSYAGYSNTHLPFLVPCNGITNMDNNKVVGFKSFITEGRFGKNQNLTKNQIVLNEISNSQHDLALKFNNLQNKKTAPEYLDYKEQMLKFWERAIPLLLGEKFNQSYYTYWIKYIKKKPRKADMKECFYSIDKPKISFLLKLNQDHLSLKIIITVKGNPIEVEYKPHLFLCDRKENCWYLMATIQDDELVNWFNNHGSLTILNSHYEEFHVEFLSNLSTNYEVYFIGRDKKKHIYEFENICKELLKPH